MYKIFYKVLDQNFSKTHKNEVFEVLAKNMKTERDILRVRQKGGLELMKHMEMVGGPKFGKNRVFFDFFVFFVKFFYFCINILLLM